MPGPSVGPGSAFGVSSICGGGLIGLAFGSSTSGTGVLGGVLAIGRLGRQCRDGQNQAGEQQPANRER